MAGLLDIFEDYEGTRRDYQEKFDGLQASNVPEVPKGAAWEQKLPVSLFYRVYGRPYAVGSVQLDLLLSEQHSLGSTVSEFPVEDGSVLSDHIQLNLRVGKLKGLVSNYSMQDEGGDGVTNRAMNAWSLFKALWARRETATIVTSLELYEDVVVTNVSTERSSGTGDALEFDVSFQEFKQPRLQEASLSVVVQPPAMDTPQRRQASKKVAAGRATGKTSARTVTSKAIVVKDAP